MGIEAIPRYRPAFIDDKSPLWDPCSLLEIINPDRGYLTCVGYAPSQRRRCRNPIAVENRRSVFMMLEVLENTSPESRSIEALLEQIAPLALCRRNHQDQADSVVAQWLSVISSVELPRRRRSSKSDSADIDTSHVRFTNTKSSNSRTGSSTSYDSKRSSQTSTSRHQACEQDTADRQQKEERARREQNRCMGEQAEKEQRERENKARIERERQEEEIRQQKSQRKREERQKQAEAKAVQERKEWDQAWETYTKGWSAFKERKQEDTTSEDVPWPVKTGCRTDVTEANVKLFFRNAPPDASIPAAMFKTMSMENMRWHPDKIGLVFKGEWAEDAATVCRTVILLRAEAQEERKKD